MSAPECGPFDRSKDLPQHLFLANGAVSSPCALINPSS
jgi:hypothetical protein